MNFPVLEQDDLTEIERIGRLRSPNEAVGALLPKSHPFRGRTVVELPNRSETPKDGTTLLLDDLRLELEEWILETPEEQVGELIIWHTHPGGLLGPSEEDMEQAVPGVPFLVVTLYPHKAVPTWYARREDL